MGRAPYKSVKEGVDVLSSISTFNHACYASSNSTPLAVALKSSPD